MKGVEFSDDALADLMDIGRYTFEQFGEQQAVKYVTELKAKVELVLQKPVLARPVSQKFPDLRRVNFKSHAVFMVEHDVMLRVLRILHQSQDPAKHLKIS